MQGSGSSMGQCRVTPLPLHADVVQNGFLPRPGQSRVLHLEEDDGVRRPFGDIRKDIQSGCWTMNAALLALDAVAKECEHQSHTWDQSRLPSLLRSTQALIHVGLARSHQMASHCLAFCRHRIVASPASTFREDDWRT